MRQTELLSAVNVREAVQASPELQIITPLLPLIEPDSKSSDCRSKLPCLLPVELLLLSRLQLSPAQQRGPARRRLPHLPVGGDGADPTVQRDELFPPGGTTAESEAAEPPSAQPASV